MTVLPLFWPIFDQKTHKCTKLNHLGAKSSKEMKKIGSEALLEILVPNGVPTIPMAPIHKHSAGQDVIFWDFWTVFPPFWPIFDRKTQKRTKLNHLGAKSYKEMKKIGSEALLEILVPKHHKNHPRAK